MDRSPDPSPPPILFRGRRLTAAKQFREGTHRTCPPEETLERILPAVRASGTTRLANVTGLDRIGFPVVLSIRPNSATLAADAGKGFTLVAAKVSAAMEALERATAETAELPTFRASCAELAGVHPHVPFAAIPRLKHSPFHERWPIEWAWGWDLLSQAEVAAPADLVPLPGQMRELDRGLLQQGSNGLTSGNHFLEALAAGLLEVIERDAVTCHKVATQLAGRSIPKVRLETIELPMVRRFLALLARADVQPVVLDCTSDVGVPVYMVDLYDRSLPHGGVFRGYGAHLDPEIALLRALTEAAQSRLVYIAGSRDDLCKDDFAALQREDREDLARGRLAMPATVDARQTPCLATDTFEGDVAVLLDRLRRAGLGQVIVFDLTPPELPVAVLRVIVPGLEGYMFDFYAPGPRARAFVREVTA